MTCKAHLGTIAALKQVILAQTQSMKLLAEKASAVTAVTAVTAPTLLADQIDAALAVANPAPEHMPRMWRTEEEEEALAEYAEDLISEDQLNERLAAIQAQNPPLSVVR